MQKFSLICLGYLKLEMLMTGRIRLIRLLWKVFLYVFFMQVGGFFLSEFNLRTLQSSPYMTLYAVLLFNSQLLFSLLKMEMQSGQQP